MNFINLADSDAFLMYKSFKNIYQKILAEKLAFQEYEKYAMLRVK